MPTALRIDRGTIGQFRVDDNGNLLVEAAITRTGVFTYQHRDKNGKTFTTREARLPEDVFHPDAMKSFIQVPVTDEHPFEGAITPENVKRHAVGNLGDTIKRDGRFVKADLIIRDAKMIAKIKGDGGKPKREVSCGYKADVIGESGVYMGERYDQRQTHIRGNHLAIVRVGRAGPDVRLMMDSADAILLDDDTKQEPSDEMKKKISAKIELLVKEGKSQEQAAAIAYSMAKEGKLDADDDDVLKSKIEAKIKSLMDDGKDREEATKIANALAQEGKLDADEDGDDGEEDADSDEEHDRRVGETRSGQHVYVGEDDNDFDDWTVDDHQQAAWMIRNEYENVRQALSTIQRLGLGGDVEGQLKDELGDLDAQYKMHKRKGMTLDSRSIADSAPARVVLMHNDAEGEGSKGGHIIGHTKSGKPIYNKMNHPGHDTFEPHEHDQAANLHGRLALKAANEKEKKHHVTQASGHRTFASDFRKMLQR